MTFQARGINSYNSIKKNVKYIEFMELLYFGFYTIWKYWILLDKTVDNAVVLWDMLLENYWE